MAEDSYFQHQVASGSWDLQLGAYWKERKTQYVGNGHLLSKQKTSGEFLSGEYGFNDFLALGAGIGIESTRLRNSTPSENAEFMSKGATDPQFLLKGRIAMALGTLYGGTTLTYPTQKHVIEASGNSNMASGGTSVTPYIGYEIARGDHTMGVRVAYQVWLGSRQIEDRSFGLNSTTITVDEQVTGGNVLTASTFYEFAWQRLTMGLAALVEETAAKTTTYDATQSRDTSPDRDSPTGRIALQFYAPVELGLRFTLLPSIEVGRYHAIDTENVHSIHDFKGQVQARYTF